MGASEATFYRRKRQFAGSGVAVIRRLKQLENENSPPKTFVADPTLNRAVLQEVLKRKW
jgi:putative transposase